MGCISSKHARTQSPTYDLPIKKTRTSHHVANKTHNHHHQQQQQQQHSSRDSDSISDSDSSNQSVITTVSSNVGSTFTAVSSNVASTLEKIKEEPEKEEDEESVSNEIVESKKNSSKSSKKSSSEKKHAFSIRFGRLTEGEHVAAGWPTWLTAVAGEAVDGWIPLKSDNFERLDKIGQGTYSSVYRAREVQTGRMVALKKVKFDNFEQESVRFMAREIAILRRLDHPNIMKLEGIITSRLSCNLYFVFEYMEHDLSGLLSCPDIKFTESQIKCYIKQLLSGLEHCHSQGVLHRDIKTSNILINNEGILKIADFGLANFVSTKNTEPLTSRVVTLWYRPPELLLGSTSYGASVDMWSVGCVFAELFTGRPILKGRTEVEQLHKIFKLCGTPSDDYWKKSKLPLANMFKPTNPYESTLREKCKEFPKSAVNLLETLLSIEPNKRGTASAALDSEYFSTRPHACDPSTMPRFPPNKKIDAKHREETRRKKASARFLQANGTSRNPRKVRKTLQESSSFFKVVPTEEMDTNFKKSKKRSKGVNEQRGSLKSSYDTVSEASQVTSVSQGTSIQSMPPLTVSNNNNWSKNRRQSRGSSRLVSQGNGRSSSRGVEPTPKRRESLTFENQGGATIGHAEILKHATRRQQRKRNDSFDSSDLFQAEDLLEDEEERVHLSKALSIRIGGKHEIQTRQATRRSELWRD